MSSIMMAGIMEVSIWSFPQIGMWHYTGMIVSKNNVAVNRYSTDA